MKMIARRKSEQNEAAVDPWTVIHLASGLALGLTRVPLKVSLGVSFVWEIVEQYVERQEWGREIFKTSHPETLPNAIIDTVAMIGGHWLGKRWNETG